MIKKSKIYQTALKEMLGSSPDLEHVRSLLEQAVEEGDADACYALGSWYFYGVNNIEKDLSKSLLLYKQACNKYQGDACFELALCYETGVGIKANPTKALHNYIKAALSGDKKSVFEIGRCLYYGIGIDANQEIAEILIDYAETNGLIQNQDYET